MATAEKTDPYAFARKCADQDFRDHGMTVKHDDGLYRHLRFSRPGTGMYSYSLVTWPGYLTISGDLESFTFCRVQDMFEFFAGNADINPGYWSEKITNQAARRGTRVYSRTVFEKRVNDALRYAAEDRSSDWLAGARTAWAKHIEDEDLYGVGLDYEGPARQMLDTFQYDGFAFSDTSEWEPTEWDHHFLMACFAIHRGIAMYRAAQPPVVREEDGNHA